jgi:hypothetical protein
MLPHSEIVHVVYRQAMAGSNYSISCVCRMRHRFHLSLVGLLVDLITLLEVVKSIKSDLFTQFHTRFFGSYWSHQIAASSLPPYLFLMTTVHLF